MLFNFHEATGKWYPNEFHNVSLTAANANAPTPDAGMKSADAVEIIIRTAADKSNTENGVTVRYVEPKQYAALESPVGYFTFKPEQDFFYVGACAAGAYSEDDYEDDNGFYHFMNKSYDGVYLIQSATFYSLIPHFEIGGR
jgi:hypothetical protein